MAIQRRHKEAAEVSTESLNDIMFFLLLFFLILSTLVNPSIIKLNLPSADKTKDMVSIRIELAVTKDLQYYVDNRPFAFAELENAILVRKNELEAKAREKKGGSVETAIVLRLDKELTIQDAVDIMQLGSKMKIKMVLATKNQ
jgi:biopolymer transport protein ExbD